MSQGWKKLKGAAKHIDMSERTMRDLLKEGLPHIRLSSGTILINLDLMDQWLLSFDATRNKVDALVDRATKGM